MTLENILTEATKQAGLLMVQTFDNNLFVAVVFSIITMILKDEFPIIHFFTKYKKYSGSKRLFALISYALILLLVSIAFTILFLVIWFLIMLFFK